MRNISTPALIVMVATGCASTSPEMYSEGKVVSPKNYQEFIPIDPMPSPFFTTYDSSEQPTTARWESLSSEQVSLRLPNQTATIIVQKLDNSGSVKYLTAALTREAGSYRATLDYVKYLVEEVTDDTGEHVLGHYRVGVGLRIKADVKTTKEGIDLGSLFAIGLAAQQGDLRGQVSVDTIGLDSPVITQLFPLPSQIDETSIQKSLEALAAIKSKLSDKDTHLTPQIVAIKISDPKLTISTAKAKLSYNSAM